MHAHADIHAAAWLIVPHNGYAAAASFVLSVCVFLAATPDCIMHRCSVLCVSTLR